MANVFDVADFFVSIANQTEDDQITNLKLNKLLFYAQGTFLARVGEKLFGDQIEAWDLGPVVPPIYRKYKICGKMPISGSDDVDCQKFTEDEMDAMLDVYREFGQYTGAKLVTLTHRQGTPWSEARLKGCKVIDDASIKAYFLNNPVARVSDKINSPIVKELPADWYDPSEDSEWEAYL